MAEINHRVGIHTGVDALYQALTTDAGLAAWWTSDTSGAGAPGATITFNFNETAVRFTVAELQENKLVRWEHAGTMPDGWMGTDVIFEIQPEDTQVFVRFRHANWAETSDFLAHCTTKWAIFLMSLKDYLETGTGKPFPRDIHIDHS